MNLLKIFLDVGLFTIENKFTQDLKVISIF